MKNILFSFLLLTSFSAYSATYQVTTYGNSYTSAIQCFGVNIGSIYSDDLTGCEIGSTFEQYGETYEVISTSVSSTLTVTYKRLSNGKIYSGHLYGSPAVCAPPKEIIDGLCVDPPPFCESDEYNDLYMEALGNCDTEGGSFTASCDIETGDYSFACNVPEPCMIGSAIWPACSDAVNDNLQDPTAPLTPIPSPNPDPITPSTPKDTDTPTGDDSGSNTDLINSMVSLNNDLNTGVASLSDDIKTNGSLIQANNDLLVSQMQQNSEIHENNKALMLAQTNAVVGALGDLGAAMNDIGGTDEDKIIDGLNGSLSDNGSCTTFSCEGNEAMCYLALKEWEQNCERDRAFGSGGAGEGLLSDLTDWSNDESRSKEAIYEDGGDLSNAFDHYGTGNGFSFDSACPSPYTIQVMNADFTLDYQPFCDLAAIIRVLILASASLFSVLMIVKFS